MQNQENYVIIFNSASQSILLLKILRSKGYNVKVISSPCRISTKCARAIKFKEEDLDAIKDEVSNNNISLHGIYKITSRGFRVDYTKI